MHQRLRTVIAACAAVAAIGGLVAAAPGAAAGPAPVRHAVGTVNQVVAGSSKFDDDSLNWAGYYVTSASVGPVTQASTRVVTPKPKVLPPTLSASWVGIG